MYMRDVRKPLELSDSDLQGLVSKLEDISGTKFNEKFADHINNFIGILREKYLIDQNAPNHKKMNRELLKLKNALVRVSDIELGQNVEMMLYGSIKGGISAFSESCDAIENLIQACGKAKDDLKKQEKQTKHTFPATLQAMATELARELSSFDIKITTYQDGIFENCLREFFNSMNGSVNGRTFNIYIPEDLFKYISKAKKDYTNTERFILLRFR